MTHADAAARRRLVVAMRRAGNSYAQIAEVLGISCGYAFQLGVRQDLAMADRGPKMPCTIKHDLKLSGLVKTMENGSPYVTKPGEKIKRKCGFCGKEFLAKSHFNRFCKECARKRPERLAPLEDRSLYGIRQKRKRAKGGRWG